MHLNFRLAADFILVILDIHCDHLYSVEVSDINRKIFYNDCFNELLCAKSFPFARNALSVESLMNVNIKEKKH